MKLTIENKRTKIWILVIALTCLLLGYYIARPKPLLVEIGYTTRGQFIQYIKVDGIARSKNRHIVPSFAEGDIRRVSLKVGDRVKRGQTIVQLLWDMKFDPVKAPIDGVVSKVFRESAGPIHRGDPIIEIVDPDQLEIVAELLTTDAVQVETGDPIRVEGWGGSTPLQGIVTRISKAGFIKPSALGVEEEKTEVTADLVEVPPEVKAKMGSNFHVSIEIQIEKHDGVLKIPVGSIFRSGSNWAVYKIQSGRALLNPIEIGGRNNQEVFVVSGLQVGDRVINYPGDLIQDGKPVEMLR